MSAICFNITSSTYYYCTLEAIRFSSIYQGIDSEIPPAGRIETLCSFLTNIGLVTTSSLLLPPPASLPTNLCILGCQTYVCVEKSNGEEYLSGYHRTSKVACLALNSYCQTRI